MTLTKSIELMQYPEWTEFEDANGMVFYRARSTRGLRLKEMQSMRDVELMQVLFPVQVLNVEGED